MQSSGPPALRAERDLARRADRTADSGSANLGSNPSLGTKKNEYPLGSRFLNEEKLFSLIAKVNSIGERQSRPTLKGWSASGQDLLTS